MSSKLYLTLAAACVLGAAGLAEAQAQAPAAPSPAASADAATLIHARQAGFAMSAVTFGAMKKATDNGAEAKTQAFAANALNKWAKALPTLFPAGSASGAPTRARPEIWSDRAGFDKAAQAYADSTGKLLDLAKAGDTAGFKAQLVEVDKTCDACHAAYRSK